MEEVTGTVLVVERGLSDVSVIPLDSTPHLIGKLPTANTPLDNPYVSRHHAQIDLVKGRYLLRDLGSKNGTFVNGRPVGQRGQRLQSGDRIELGRGQVVLRFQRWDTTLTLPPAPEGSPERGVVVDARSREVYLEGRLLQPPLSRKEFDVLHLLHQRLGEACSKDDIAARGWPERPEADVGDQEIEQCIRRLRLRVEPDPSQPRHVVTVRGYGYKLTRG